MRKSHEDLSRLLSAKLTCTLVVVLKYIEESTLHMYITNIVVNYFILYVHYQYVSLHVMELRKTDRFKVTLCKTARYKNSAIPSMQVVLNENN